MKMTDERVLDLIAAYGAEPMGWPEEDRDAAQAHIAARPERFSAALEEAKLLDLAFEQADILDVPVGLSERILADAPQARRGRAGFAGRFRDMVFPNGVRWPAGATAAALFMGLIAGVYSAPATADDSYTFASEDLIYGALGYDGLEVYAEEVSG